LSNHKIIVVEDKAIIALDIKTYLTNNGYKNTSFFLNGDTALKFISKNKPDLALIDVILHSNANGIDIARELKKLSVPFIFVSAFSNPYQYKEALDLKPSAVFIKPINLAEILSAIRIILKNNKNLNNKLGHTDYN
jgi:DNA-binding response OmpR family regulator